MFQVLNALIQSTVHKVVAARQMLKIRRLPLRTGQLSRPQRDLTSCTPARNAPTYSDILEFLHTKSLVIVTNPNLAFPQRRSVMEYGQNVKPARNYPKDRMQAWHMCRAFGDDEHVRWLITQHEALSRCCRRQISDACMSTQLWPLSSRVVA